MENINKAYETPDGVFYHSRSVAVISVVILYKGLNQYVLCGKRGTGTPDFQGFWNIPAGYLDWNEYGYEGAIREIWEETGLKIKKEDFDNEPWSIKTNPNSNRQNVTLRYGIYISADEFPVLNSDNSEPNEVAELEWVHTKQLNKKKWAFNHDKVILDFLALHKPIDHVFVSNLGAALRVCHIDLPVTQINTIIDLVELIEDTKGGDILLSDIEKATDIEL